VFVLEVNINKLDKDINRILSYAKYIAMKKSTGLANSILKDTLRSGNRGLIDNKQGTPPLSFLASFVVTKNNIVGFLKENKIISIKNINKHQTGYHVKVTPRMRRFLASKKYFIKKSTRTLKVPARPFIKLATTRINKELPLKFKAIFERTISK
jgi:hypothetical protein